MEGISTKLENYCYQCGSVFATEDELFTHVGDMHYFMADENAPKLELTNMRKDSNDEVRKVVSKKVTVKRDTKVIPLNGPFLCMQSMEGTEESCNTTYNDCCEFSMHYFSQHHSQRNRALCMICEKKLTSNEDDLKPVACEKCGKVFPDKEAYRKHYLTHAEARPFQCDSCDKRFTQLANLQNHARTHTGERPFPCQYCDKRFGQKSGRDQHMRLHTKERPYTCVVCNKTFTQVAHLRQHMRVHTNAKPYACSYCSSKFKQVGHLKQHLMVHSDTKPFKCEYCPSTFKQASHLKVHTSRKHSSGEVVKIARSISPISSTSQEIILSPRKINIVRMEVDEAVANILMQEEVAYNVEVD